ncbi:hypothetical protein ACOJVU_20780 [Mycobacterium sp. THU-M104]|uniref:hypothetical protein n=1 Tax=Mycobacterium sp. THU-M104 TaxID=3410515 RepID=UPI003B9DAB5A
MVVTVVAGPDRGSIEQTLKSFLHCCLDVSRVGRFLVFDAGLSTEDRALLQDRYGFLDVVSLGAEDQPAAPVTSLRAHVDARFWLHLGQGWRFFAPDSLLSRLTAVLRAEADVMQVGINFADAVTLTGACAADDVVRRGADTGRYVLAAAQFSGPATFDTVRLGRVVTSGRGSRESGFGCASLDEVLCLKATAAPTGTA